MNTQNQAYEDELDRQMEAAVRRKNEYDEWLGNLAADCIRRGIAIPSGIERGNAWVAHLRKVGEENKRKKKAEKLQEKIRKMQATIASLSGQTQSASATSQTHNLTNTDQNKIADEPDEPDEPGDDFFAAMDAGIKQLQDTLGLQNRIAEKEQEILFGKEQGSGQSDKLQALRAADLPNEGEVL